MPKFIFLALAGFLIFLLDLYVFGALRLLLEDSNPLVRRWVFVCYWSVSALTIALFLVYNLSNIRDLMPHMGQWVQVWMFMYIFSKLLGGFFLLLDDLWRGFMWIWRRFVIDVQPVEATPAERASTGISRSEFLSKASLIATAVPMATMSFGIISGAHDYRVRHRKITLPNLPKAFHGLRIAQLSDIHSGSFFNKTAVAGGVEMLMAEKPDAIFFTGDLVNNVATEVREYVPIFGKMKAPLGIYSTLGNHDYGEYVRWPSDAARRRNVLDLMQAHREMGFQLLMNEHKMLHSEGEQLAVIGVENWGTGRWPKYGRLEQAYAGTQEAAVKLLLSHDPTHWDGQVRPLFPDIDITFSGHTHGFQFGVEIGDFRWSPASWVYKQWADLYREGNQYLYVNRGFGYLGYPGRVGILPEITIFELLSGR